MKLNSSVISSGEKIKMLNIKELKQKLLSESKYITDLSKRLPIPASAIRYVTEELETENGGLGNKQFKKQFQPVVKSVYGEGTTRAKSLEELHNKLNKLKGKKLIYKDKLLKKGLKNRLTKKKRKEERNLKKKMVRVEKLNPKQEIETKPLVKSVKPVYNSEGRMVFSKFDFSDSGTTSEVAGKKPKEPRKLLQKLEKQSEKLKRLESEGAMDKVNRIKENMAWKSALKRTEGAKVMDNPELIKKSLKKKVDKKRQSKKKWEARESRVKKQLEDRQKKRTENIQQRKKDIKTKKFKKAAKKGRMIPGF